VMSCLNWIKARSVTGKTRRVPCVVRRIVGDGERREADAVEHQQAKRQDYQSRPAGGPLSRGDGKWRNQTLHDRSPECPCCDRRLSALRTESRAIRTPY